jgi:hypothetical protein
VVPSNGEEEEIRLAPIPEETKAPKGLFVSFITKALKFMLMPILKVIFAPTAQKAFVKTAMMGMTVSLILMTSLVAYVTFYKYYVPPIAHVNPIWFQYTHPQMGPHALIDLSKSGATIMVTFFIKC